jgi:phosphoglycerate dehydrogenase-like enzyme
VSTTPPLVVVCGASADEPPPGIAPGAELADLRYAADADALHATIADADALFFWRARKGWIEERFGDASRLRWIQSASDGVDGLLFPALAASEVMVTNARGVFDEPIAEWVIAAIAAFVTGLHTSVRDQARGTWVDGRERQRITGQHLVVVGPGPIGRATATRARALGMTVEAVGRRPRSDPVLGKVVGPDGLHAALGRADHVLDALPLTAATQGFFDAAAFSAMRPGARFYNVGRGGTVDEAALVEALATATIAGAALDVFEREPLPEGSPLWTMPNVIVSPHVCGDVIGWEAEVVALFVDNLRRFARHEPLRNLVDTAAGFGVG